MLGDNDKRDGTTRNDNKKITQELVDRMTGKKKTGYMQQRGKMKSKEH